MAQPTPPTPEPENRPPKAAPRRAGRPGLLVPALRAGLLAGLLILAVFHQTLILHTLRAGAIWMARQHQMELDFQIGGNLCSSELFVQNLSASARGPGALREVKVKRAKIRYSLREGWRYGRGEMLKALQVDQVSVVVDPAQAEPGKGEPIQIKPPALIPNELEVHDASLLVKAPARDWGFRGGELALYPNHPGFIRVKCLEFPDGRTVRDLEGKTSYTVGSLRKEAARKRVIGVSNLELNPDLRIREILLNLPEASKSGRFGMKAALEGFRGDLQVSASLEFRDGQANWSAQANRGQAVARLSGTGILSAQSGRAGEASGQYQVRIPDLPEVLAVAGLEGKEKEVGGSLEGRGTYRLHEGRLATVLNLSGSDLCQGGRYCERAEVEVAANGPFPSPVAGLLKALQARVSARLGPLGLWGSWDSGGGGDYGKYRVDGGNAELVLRGNQVEIKEVQFNRGTNHLALHGTYQSPGDSLSLLNGVLEAWVDLNAPRLESIAGQLGGAVSLHGRVSRRVQEKENLLDGQLAWSGSGLRLGEFAADSLRGELEVIRNQAFLKAFRVDFNSEDSVTGNGEVYLGGGFPYRAQVQAKMNDLVLFEPLLRAAGVKEALGGGLDLAWSGTGGQGGHGGNGGHDGKLNLTLRNGRFGTIEGVEALASGTYSSEEIRFDRFRVATNQGSVETSLYYSNSLLSAQNVMICQGNLVALAGNAFIPMELKHWNDPGRLIPANGELAVDLFSQAVDLKALAASLKEEWPVSGTVSGHFQARGPMDDLKAEFRLQGNNLKSTKVEKLAPAQLDLGLSLQKQRLTLKGVLSQPRIQPLKVMGELPLDLRKTLAEKNLDQSSRVLLRAVMPRTSLAFLAEALPGVRFLEGEVALDAGVNGTIGNPVLTGSARFNVPALRFQKAVLPSIGNLQGNLVFKGNELAIERLQGEVGGGPFRLVGRIRFPKLTEPVLDLRADSRNLLVQRNNALTVRVNSDLLVEGPIGSGTLSGVVGITNSRFFREIEILPIGLPGRPTRRAPKLEPQLVLPQALEGWNFDVRIRTDDPFKLRSNLARGEMGVALAFKGSGGSPSLDGQIQIQNLTATLPFSKMNVDYGYLYFDPRTGLDPKLDIHGTSDLREYHIDIYIHGTAQDPQSTLTSDPPLAQEDIVALLATGATAKEISGSPDVLAGRAAVLLFDRIYRKIFKKNAPGSEESVPSRIQFDFGGVSSTTGQQEMRTQFKMTDNIYLIGEVGIQGEVGGKIKYVLRFR